MAFICYLLFIYTHLLTTRQECKKYRSCCTQCEGYGKTTISFIYFELLIRNKIHMYKNNFLTLHVFSEMYRIYSLPMFVYYMYCIC